jgi:tetratricopeptide (TPR) repeat protein
MRKPDQGMFEDAIRCYQDGKLAAAEQLFRMILESHPRHADSLHVLGLIAYQGGGYESAFELLELAIAINRAQSLLLMYLARSPYFSATLLSAPKMAAA